MSLYQKHRPLELPDVVGNREVILTLRNMIKKPDQTPHAFLFCGPYGCGKTTLARILANDIGCTPNNIIEIDTAQFNGIDTVRDLRQKAQFLPLGGGKRFYIIDEVHKMTTDAQNAFLKILEDTPKHVYFALCTTNENSLLPTVKSRCSRFQVQVLKDEEMVSLLQTVLEKEEQELSNAVINAIVKSADGHPRNALTLLEQVLATPEKRRVNVAQQAQVLETESIELCRALIAGKGWSTVKGILQGLKEQDAEGIRRHVLGYMTSVLLKEDNEVAGLVLECFEEPFYNGGFPLLVSACYKAVKS